MNECGYCGKVRLSGVMAMILHIEKKHPEITALIPGEVKYGKGWTAGILDGRFYATADGETPVELN